MTGPQTAPIQVHPDLAHLDQAWAIQCEYRRVGYRPCVLRARYCFRCRTCGEVVLVCATHVRVELARFAENPDAPLGCIGCGAEVLCRSWAVLFTLFPIGDR